MCSLWCADFPHRPVVLFGFSERENLGGLLLFDVMMMVTYRSRFKGRYAHPWPLPLQNITTDKL